ncbi:hypothetical protein M0812_04590 [Anaeramoeba flamelloides]|uniref:Ras-GAP domain-containing protein n=1 Tax=Anaeramoeba flamelloides TaxID=1746091 RepID=A0AAV8AEW7_9EUKA|nr:hypothetical protein M0812_04590 [Anaeramoeba flamelloides]
MSKLRFFKQTVKEKIINAKKSELTSEFFFSGLKQSKEVKKQLRELISKTKHFVSTVSNDIKIHQDFIKTYRLYSKTINNEEGEIDIVTCLIKVAEISTSLIHLHDSMQKKLSGSVLSPSQTWLNKDYKNLMQTKKEYESLRRQFDSSHSTRESYKKKKEQDPKKLEMLENDVVSAKEKLLKICGDLYFSLDELVSGKDANLLQIITNSLQALQKYYYDGYTNIYESFDYIGQVKEKVEQMINQFNSENREKDMMTLTKAQEDDDSKYDSLVMCLSSQNQSIVASLITATASDPEILKSLIRVYEAYGQTRNVLQNCINKEVENTQSSAQLFRENTPSTKLTSSFTKVIGNNYRKETLLSLVQWIQDNPRGYECNSNKCKKDENADENIQNILETSQMFLESIINSIDQAPLPMRCICYDLRQAVKKRFPDQELQSVGSYIFLRFFCPGISNLQVSGVQEELKTQPDKVLLQTALMVTRLLQSLANGTYFDKKNPELKGLNVFIDNNKNDIKAFFNNFSIIPENQEYTPIASLDEVKKLDLPLLHQTICENIDEITKFLHSKKEKQACIDLFNALKLIGPTSAPPEKKKKK